VKQLGSHAFSLRALHSVSGVVPLALIMLLQVWTHAKALDGRAAHADALRVTSELPLFWHALVLVPLVFHALYGVGLAARPQYNVGRYPHSRNWMFTMQRVSGVLALLFVTFHLANFWLPMRLGELDASQLPELLVAQLSASSGSVPWTALAYLVGFGACAFHLATGLWTFSIRWGLTPSRTAQSRAGLVFALVGVAMFGAGAMTITHLATGWPVGEPDAGASEAVTCEGPSGPGATAAAARSSAQPATAAPAPSATTTP